MRTLRLLALAACALVPTLLAAAPIADGKPAPAFTVKTLAGKTIRLSDYRNKVVLLDFGAVECPPCRLEMPVLQRFHRKYARQGLVVLGLLEMNPKREAARKMQKQRGLTYPLAIDAGENIGKRYGLTAHPTAILIDRAGNVVKTEIGYVRGDEKGVEQAFLPLLTPAKEAKR